MKEQNKMDKDLTDFLGVSHSTITKWKYDGGNVYLKYIDEICEFLDTTPNYLFWGYYDDGEVSKEEMDLIRMYRKLDSKGRKCIKETMSLLQTTK